MEDKRLIHSIKIANLLSFGPDGTEVALSPLNVLVGANGSGKSNFLEVFRLLKAAPRDFQQPFREGGGVSEWIWKGANSLTAASLDVVTALDDTSNWDYENKHEYLIGHEIIFGLVAQRTAIFEEKIWLALSIVAENESVGASGRVFIEDLYQMVFAKGVIDTVMPAERKDDFDARIKKVMEAGSFRTDQSVLSQRNDPDSYPELNFLYREYGRIAIFLESSFGRLTPARRPQDAALDSSFLFEDASNLALVLNDLQNQPQVMRNILEKLKLFYERVENIITRVQGGTVQIYFQEAGLTQTVPATRLSDGTLRYLCLLVILLHPTPPPLICIEEPEMGMHPDILPTIAELLIEASQRTQLIVTTHSDRLVSAIGEKHPEAILVCDRTSKGTTLTRLEPEKLTEWLKDYALGDVWLKGAIGGTRW